MRTSLGPGFRSLYLGSLVSNTGDGIRLAVVPLLAASLTSSRVLIGAVTAAQYLPWITFAPIGGALVDRWTRRRTILITQAWRGIVMAGLAVLVATSSAEIWHLCVVAFLITVGEILVDPSTVALVPKLVDDADLDRANGQISSVEIVTNDFAGGPVGAALFGFAPWLPFLVDGLTYLGSLFPFSRLPKPAARRARLMRSQSLRRDAADGFRWLRRHRVLGPFTLAQIVYFFGVATSLSMLVVLVTDELQASEFSFGLVLAIGAAGAFAGTLIAGSVTNRLGNRVTLAGAVALQAVTLAAAALAGSVPVLAAVWFLNGLPAGLQRPVARSLQQRLTPNELLGRVNVSSRMFTRGIIVFGALFAGLLAESSGLRATFAAAGAVQLLAAIMIWRALSRMAEPIDDMIAAEQES